MPITEGIQIPISADLSDLQKGMQAAKASIADALTDATNQFDQFNRVVRELESTKLQDWASLSKVELKDLNNAISQNRLGASLMAQRIKELTEEQNSLGGSTQATRNVMMAFNRVVKDSHSLLYSSTRGIAELTYALPYLFQRIGEVKQETGSWKSALSVLSGSLLNWQGLLFAAGTAVAFYLRGHKEAKKEIDEHAKALDGFEKKAAEEMIRFRELTIAVSDTTRSMKERRGILGELRSQYEPYLRGLSNEKILAGQIGDAYEKMVEHLRSKIALQAAEDRIVPIIKQQLDLQLKNVELQKAVDAAAGDKKYLTAQDLKRDAVRRLAAEQHALSEKSKKDIEDNNKAIASFQRQIENAISAMRPLIQGTVYNDEKEKKKKEKKEDPWTRIQNVSIEVVGEKLFGKHEKDLDKIRRHIQHLKSELPDYIQKEIAWLNEANRPLREKVENYAALATMVVQNLTPAFQGFFESIISGSGNAIQSFTKAIGQMISKLISAIAAAATLGAILAATGLGSLIGFGSGFSGSFTGLLNGMLGLNLHVPGHAAGGITTKPHLAMVGEGKEREAIMPLSRLNEFVKNARGSNAIPVPQLFMKGSDFWIMYQKSQRNNQRSY